MTIIDTFYVFSFYMSTSFPGRYQCPAHNEYLDHVTSQRGFEDQATQNILNCV